MRTICSMNPNWIFTKTKPSDLSVLPAGEKVNLPHTWNATDGQDGGNDYYRGTCYYSKRFLRSQLPAGAKFFLEVDGANSSADVYLNGKHLGHHDGGYSTWRVDLTGNIADENVLTIAVDNAANDRVYPQMADFTFYGGLYRDVKLIVVEAEHFDLEYYGAPGIKVTPVVKDKDAIVEVEVFTKDVSEGATLTYTIASKEGKELVRVEVPAEQTKKKFKIGNVHLWHGRKDPYLYTASVSLSRDGKMLDKVATRFGCRSFAIDPNRGFLLNGKEYPLRGVSRHQDRLGIGNALLPEHHKEDVDLILEMGANTVRLAHYQHNQYFYDLCDAAGLVVWAEIPYISNHMPTARENTITQMTELVAQNYNHASIVVWGLSNEITMKGDADPDLLENHRILNDLCHKMDKTRLTTVAVVSMCPTNSPYLDIADVVSYNHYFGWYGGDTSMNGPWLDKFHKEHPRLPIGVSEYGCEALNWHTSEPRQGDYTEEYQAYYHEELIKQLFTRKYLWATHVWNMFDFGADARAEGGENGQNHKGLVTMDRKYKKDSFYAYKAWLSDDPFVHICGKRYVDRVEESTKVTVYSNLPEVELFANGKSLGKQTAKDHFFYFDVPNTTAETNLTAVAGQCTDSSLIRKVDKFNEDYRLKEVGAVLNWFDIESPEGRYSLNDTISSIMKSGKGKLWFAKVGLAMKKKMSAGKKDKKAKGEDKEKKGGFDVDLSAGSGLMDMMGGFTVLRLTSMMGMMNISFTKEELLKMNRQLNKIKKPKGVK